MKTSHTFSILFWINSSRSTNNKADLFLRITVNGRRANIGLKRKILIDQWDKKAKKVKNVDKQKIDNYFNQSKNNYNRYSRSLLTDKNFLKKIKQKKIKF